MNEFIVWDEKLGFSRHVKLGVSKGINFDTENWNNMLLLKPENIFEYIKKDDIEGKKIYADSSIFEFVYMNKKLKGIFSFSNINLRYYIKVLDSLLPASSSLHYDQFHILNIKIIDTIQENKLGLINE